jgi:hypothetical protein
LSNASTDTKLCAKCGEPRAVEDFVPDRNEPDGRHAWCSKCRIALGKALSDFRRQTVIGKTAQKTSIAEDLLTVYRSSIGPTVERLLDSLAGLVESSAAAKSKNPDAVRGRNHHAPMPQFESSWADTIVSHADDQLWELSESVHSFLNRPEDPTSWSACDTCGNRRIGQATYCHTCGTRILAGARRCRITGCPNNNKRRALCPRLLPTPDGFIEHP